MAFAVVAAVAAVGGSHSPAERSAAVGSRIDGRLSWSPLQALRAAEL